MIDLKRTGSGRKLLQQVLSQSSSKEKDWSKTQRLETQTTHKNSNNQTVAKTNSTKTQQ